MFWIFHKYLTIVYRLYKFDLWTYGWESFCNRGPDCQHQEFAKNGTWAWCLTTSRQTSHEHFTSIWKWNNNLIWFILHFPDEVPVFQKLVGRYSSEFWIGGAFLNPHPILRAKEVKTDTLFKAQTPGNIGCMNDSHINNVAQKRRYVSLPAKRLLLNVYCKIILSIPKWIHQFFLTYSFRRAF